MTVVVDLGCYDHDPAFSSLRDLNLWFAPQKAYGFDVLADDRDALIAGVPTMIRRAAASTFNGASHYNENGTRTKLANDGDEVPAFDFSAWLAEHGPAIVKMDIEGHEYPVLEKMHADGTDELVTLLVVEWHGPPMTGLRCLTTKWWN